MRRLSSGTVGAVAELIVAADLLSLGYEVFRSVSQSCSCDLVALREGSWLRIEVRTGSRLKSGGLTFSFKPRDENRHDVMAVYVPGERSITYRPDIRYPQ